MLQRAIFHVSIQDTRTDKWVFQNIEVTYPVNVDPEADEDTQQKQAIFPLFEHLNRVLRTLPKGTRVVNNRKHYFLAIQEDFKLEALQ